MTHPHLSTRQRWVLFQMIRDGGLTAWGSFEKSIRALVRLGLAKPNEKWRDHFHATDEGRALNRLVNAKDIAQADKTYRSLRIPPVVW